MFFVSKDKSLPLLGRLFDCSYNCNYIYIYVYNYIYIYFYNEVSLSLRCSTFFSMS